MDQQGGFDPSAGVDQCADRARKRGGQDEQKPGRQCQSLGRQSSRVLLPGHSGAITSGRGTYEGESYQLAGSDEQQSQPYSPRKMVDSRLDFLTEGSTMSIRRHFSHFNRATCILAAFGVLLGLRNNFV